MYIPNGIKWGSSTLGTPSGEITWDDTLGGLTTAPGSSTGDLVSALRAAFGAWEDVAALDFREIGGSAEIDVGFASFSGDGDPRNDGAVATASWSGGNFYSEPTGMRIEFNSDETWSPFGGFGAVDFFAVALHEIGHAIGLHHVDDPTQIMNPVIIEDELGNGDKAGAQAIYGLDGGDVPVDPDPGGGLGGGGDGGGGGGIVLGLLALIVGLFTGGLGAAAVVAAGRVADEEDDAPEPMVDDHDHDHLHEDFDDLAGGGFHASFLPAIPFEDFPQIANTEDDDEDEIFLF